MDKQISSKSTKNQILAAYDELMIKIKKSKNEDHRNTHIINMNRHKNHSWSRVWLISIILIISSSYFVLAQPAPPAEHGSGDNKPAGGGAPIGSGVALLVALGAAYGSKKVYDFRKHKLAE